MDMFDEFKPASERTSYSEKWKMGITLFIIFFWALFLLPTVLFPEYITDASLLIIGSLLAAVTAICVGFLYWFLHSPGAPDH